MPYRILQWVPHTPAGVTYRALSCLTGLFLHGSRAGHRARFCVAGPVSVLQGSFRVTGLQLAHIRGKEEEELLNHPPPPSFNHQCGALDLLQGSFPH